MSPFTTLSDPCPRCVHSTHSGTVVHNTQNGVVVCGLCTNRWLHIGDFKREVAAKALAFEADDQEPDGVPELHEELEELVSLVRKNTWEEVQDALSLAIGHREISVIIAEDSDEVIEKSAEIAALKSMLNWVNGKLKDEQ